MTCIQADSVLCLDEASGQPRIRGHDERKLGTESLHCRFELSLVEGDGGDSFFHHESPALILEELDVFLRRAKKDFFVLYFQTRRKRCVIIVKVCNPTQENGLAGKLW